MQLANFDTPDTICEFGGYVPEEVSDEENEEIGRLLDSLTEDDLKIARITTIYLDDDDD